MDIEALLEELEPLVQARAWFRDPCQQWHDDLLQEGRLAIIQAAPRYRPEKGPKQAFFGKTIDGAMLNWLTRKAPLVKYRRYHSDRGMPRPEIVPLKAAEEAATADGSPVEAEVTGKLFWEQVFARAHLTPAEMRALQEILIDRDLTRNSTRYAMAARARAKLLKEAIALNH